MESSKDEFTRPPGPPIVWRTIEVKEKSNINTIQLSIQDIPEVRHEEVLDHMCQYFLADEPMDKCLDTINDQDSVDSIRLCSNYFLKQGWCIGAFKLNSDGQLGELIAVNMLFLWNDEIEKKTNNVSENSKSPRRNKISKFLNKVACVFKDEAAYGTDTRYFCEYGLSVNPSFRGQKIGFHLLDVWSDIGRKYGIKVGLIILTSKASQLQGERANFKTIHTVNYKDAVDDNGKLLFPNIKEEKLVLAVKRL